MLLDEGRVTISLKFHSYSSGKTYAGNLVTRKSFNWNP